LESSDDVFSDDAIKWLLTYLLTYLFFWICCRFVSVYSTQSDALHLMMSLIKHKLCQVDAGDVWSLFESTAVHPTAVSLCFLAMFLDENGAPEHGKNTAAVKKPVRSQLLNWLLCCRTEFSSDEFVPAATHLDARLVSKVLIALTVRDAHVSHECTCGVLHSVSTFSGIERLCLLSTFHSAIELPVCVSNTTSNWKKVARVSESSILYCRQEELIARLSEDIDYSLAYAKPEVIILHFIHSFIHSFIQLFLHSSVHSFID